MSWSKEVENVSNEVMSKVLYASGGIASSATERVPATRVEWCFFMKLSKMLALSRDEKTPKASRSLIATGSTYY
jgi:hypothetical protein